MKHNRRAWDFFSNRTDRFRKNNGSTSFHVQSMCNQKYAFIKLFFINSHALKKIVTRVPIVEINDDHSNENKQSLFIQSLL